MRPTIKKTHLSIVKLYMPDEQVGQEAVEGQTTEAMPTSTKPDLEVSTETQEAEPQLPEGVAERTAKEFEKLKEANRALKEQLDSRNTTTPAPEAEKRPSLYEVQFQQPQNLGSLSQGQIDNIASNFVDKDGYVDVASLNNALVQANAQARAAQEEARKAREEIEKFNHTNEVRETHNAYPELDPESTNFDPKFYDMVENQIFGQLKKNKKVSFLEAAKAVQKELYDPRQKKQEANQAQVEAKAKAQTQRAQATTPIGNSKSDYSGMSQDELAVATRKGDKDALLKRLQASGY